MEFNEKLVILRRARGLTQTDMADLLGVTRQSVYKWEKGESYPEAMTLLAMREVFGLSIDALLDPAYIIGLPEGPNAVLVTHIGEEITPTTDVTIIRMEQNEKKPVEKNVEERNAIDTVAESREDTDSENHEASKSKDSSDDGDGNVTDKKRKRGFFSRLFR